MVKRAKTLVIDGGVPAAMPTFIKPQLATLKSKAPKGAQWLHEIKYDGYRVQIHLNKGKKKVFTRNGLDWTKRFSLIAGALDLPGQAVIDGEVVVIKDGRANFSELQAELAAGRQDRLAFYAFDLLYFNGFDLCAARQIERKHALENLLKGVEAPVLYSDVRARGQAELGGHRLQERRRAVPLRSQRGMVEDQDRPEGEIPGRWLREGPDRRRRAVLGEEGGRRLGVHGQGRHGLVPDRIEPDQEAA